MIIKVTRYGSKDIPELHEEELNGVTSIAKRHHEIRIEYERGDRYYRIANIHKIEILEIKDE